MKSRWLAVLAGVGVGALSAALIAIPAVRAIEQQVGLRWLFQLRGPVDPPTDIALVLINQQAADSLSLPRDGESFYRCEGLQIGARPSTHVSVPAMPSRWPRCLHARLLRELQMAGAELVVFDVLFRERPPLPGKDGDLHAWQEGQGVPRDDAEAVKWYLRAAEQGYAKAQNNAAVMYSKGSGVPQDYSEAARWWRKAADQGQVLAQFSLGYAYDEGKGVPKDYVEAAKWFRRAAEQGHWPAQNLLGYYYAHGKGVPQDDVEAHMWFNLSAAAVPADDSEARDKAVKHRDTIAELMTPEQVGEAQKRAREWQPKKEAASN